MRRYTVTKVKAARFLQLRLSCTSQTAATTWKSNKARTSTMEAAAPTIELGVSSVARDAGRQGGAVCRTCVQVVEGLRGDAFIVAKHWF